MEQTQTAVQHRTQDQNIHTKTKQADKRTEADRTRHHYNTQISNIKHETQHKELVKQPKCVTNGFGKTKRRTNEEQNKYKKQRQQAREKDINHNKNKKIIFALIRIALRYVVL